MTTAEHQRLAVNGNKKIPLEQWGPYLSERQWGTVREDYSNNGDAWHYFPLIMPIHVLTNGERMDWGVSRIFSRIFAFLLHYGTGRTRY
jgi:hypothetical protein